MTTLKDQIREAAENDLLTFIKLVAPHRVLGQIHEDILRWWKRDEAKPNGLVLLPRDHQKSALIAYRVAWHITNNPDTTVLYISSTSNLAEKQLKFIKDILGSRIYRTYWPEMLHKDEGKRARWSVSEIEVDHPKRKEEGIRDPTVFTAGLTSSITGMHCNLAVLDDVVVRENAYTREGRRKVSELYSLLSSIETTDSQEWVVGTRYHPQDLYGEMIDMLYETYDDEGNLASKELVYEVFQKEVEDRGDGTGNYIWPRQQRGDGRWFGFNQDILAQKKAKYLDKTQFFAQYYNNPNDPGAEQISSDFFQHYDRKHVEYRDTKWHVRGRPVNVYAAIDFAFSTAATADYTAIVVVGIDEEGSYYVLDIERFKSNKISKYHDSIMELHYKWFFRKIRAEVTIAQEAIVEDLKDRIRQEGAALSIDKKRPTRHEGTKEERIHAVLAPRYENQSIWHYRGGMCEELEMELKQAKPRHDDIKDALTNAVEIAVAPRIGANRGRSSKVVYHTRFGGVA